MPWLDPVVWEVDPATGRWTFVGRRAEELLGYPAERWLADPGFWAGLVHPEERQRAAAICRAAIEGGRDREIECRVVAADGRVVRLRGVVYPVAGAGGRVRRLCGLMTDVTAWRQAEEALCRREEELRQREKMATLGRLASAVAHDFNNLLTVIAGYSEFARRQARGDERLGRIIGEALEAVERAVGRAADLTGRLLTFGRRRPQQPTIVNLGVLVADIAPTLRRLIGGHIELVTVLDPTPGRIRADPGEIEQVLLNMAANARDAMARGGTLTIETTGVELDEAHAEGDIGVPPGRYVMLAVSDTGCGMDATTRARLFEPFFTTKPPGNGTGLGLSIVHGIVRRSGGGVRVRSDPGLGSTFRIYLPRVEDAVEPPPIPRALEPPGGAETILLAEDDEAVRSLARRVLESKGYTVLEARRGEEAVAIGERHEEPIALLLADVVMPGMHGPEIAGLLAFARPGMKVLYMSGCTDESAFRGRTSGPGPAFLSKPFTLGSLTQKVREVLDARPAAARP